jgi:hypothetical protein
MHRPLPCRLSDTEIAEKAKLAAGLEQERARLDEERKQKDREYKERLTGMHHRVSALLAEIREGEQYLDVEVQWRTDFRRNLKELIRLDTGAIVDTTALSAEERQGELFLVEGESHPAEQAG